MALRQGRSPPRIILTGTMPAMDNFLAARGGIFLRIGSRDSGLAVNAKPGVNQALPWSGRVHGRLFLTGPRPIPVGVCSCASDK